MLREASKDTRRCWDIFLSHACSVCDKFPPSRLSRPRVCHPPLLCSWPPWISRRTTSLVPCLRPSQQTDRLLPSSPPSAHIQLPDSHSNCSHIASASVSRHSKEERLAVARVIPFPAVVSRRKCHDPNENIVECVVVCVCAPFAPSRSGSQLRPASSCVRAKVDGFLSNDKKGPVTNPRGPRRCV